MTSKPTKSEMALFEARAKFFELALPELSKIDQKHFTKRGWEYGVFEFLKEIDKSLSYE
jgi:hypothetical protein